VQISDALARQATVFESVLRSHLAEQTQGARVFGENLSLGCHDGEVSLSGSPDQFSCVDRARCPTPAIREPMEPFKPRALTETVVRRFFLKHNKAKLEVPGFIANLMKLPDDEIRSKCQARYHATPEPAHDDFDI